MELIFIKQKKSQGIYEETGYYFKKEFLSRYKTKAIKILRERVLKAGKGDFDKGKNIARDEWEVIHQEYLKSVEATKKTNITKKPYWAKQRIRVFRNKTNRLLEKARYLEEKKQDEIKDYDERIRLVLKEKEEIEKYLEKNQNDKNISLWNTKER